MDRQLARLRNGLQIDGRAETLGVAITVILKDVDGKVLMARGASVPSAAAGYAKGALFMKTDGVAGTTLYINEGTSTTSDFNAVKTPEANPAFTGDVTIGDTSADTLTVESVAIFKADVTLGTDVADTTILKSRLATTSVAGAALDFGATYDKGEAVELRFRVTDWTLIGGQFQGFYVRVETNIDAPTATLRGAEWTAVANAVAVQNLEGFFGCAYIKGDTAETIDNVYGLHGELSMDAGRANAITLTEAAGVLSKILSGKVADYTLIHGFLGRFGDMDGGSRKYGSGLRLLDGVEAGTSSLSNVIYTDMAADYFLEVSAADKGAVDDTIAGQTVGTINAVVKCKFGSTDFYLYGYATAPSS